MSIIVYCNGSNESFRLIQQLESREEIYEAKGIVEAHEDNIKDLPAMVVGNKVLNYKKAMKWLKKNKGEV